jgi:hypothetical protein
MIKFCKQLVGELDYERADRAGPRGCIFNRLKDCKFDRP